MSEPIIKPTPLIPPSTRSSKKKDKDSIGRAVFYPTPLPPPPRKPSVPTSSENDSVPAPAGAPALSSQSPSRLTQPHALPSFAHTPPPNHRHSGPSAQYNALGLGVEGSSPHLQEVFHQTPFQFPPHPTANSPFAQTHYSSSPSSSLASQMSLTPMSSAGGSGNRSPPLELTTILENWEAFTPEQSTTNNRDQGTDPSITSPHELALHELIDDAMIAEEESPASTQQMLNVKLAPKRDSPALFHNTPSRLAGANPFFLGSPAQPSPPGPVPTRQMPWGSSFEGRRASAPTISSRPVSPAWRFTPRVFPSHLAPSTGSPHRSALSLAQPRRPSTDIFSPNYSLCTTSPPVVDADYFSATHYIQPRAVFQPPAHVMEPTYPSEDDSSFVAAKHLLGKTLNEDFLRRYEVRDELGSGGFGFVCSAFQTGFGNDHGKEVAVKFIIKSKISDSEQALLGGIPIEAYILERVSHPNIIKTYELFEDAEFWYLVQELHGDPWNEGPTLHPPAQMGVTHHPPSVPSRPTQPLRASPVTPSVFSTPSRTSPPKGLFTTSPLPRSNSLTGWTPPAPQPAPHMQRPAMGRRASHDLFEAVESQRFSEDQARFIFRQVVEAVAYLHAQGIYHRDLKDENIVIDRNLNVKIIDFGSAVIEDPRHPRVYDQFRGTMTYASAEILAGRMYEAAPADVWSLGILLSLILTGESPFPNVAYAQQSHIRWRKWVPPGAIDLMSRCLAWHPSERWRVCDMLEHPWLRNTVQL